MKKVLFVVTSGMFVLTSCKKDYTCECTTTVGFFGMTTTTTSSTTIHDKKDKAKTKCESGNSSIPGMATVSCAIK